MMILMTSLLLRLFSDVSLLLNERQVGQMRQRKGSHIREAGLRSRELVHLLPSLQGYHGLRQSDLPS